MILEKSRTVQNVNAQKIRLSGESLRDLPIHGGRYAPGVDGINTDTVVTDHDVAEDNAPDLGYRHFPSLNLIELFLFQRGEEASPSGRCHSSGPFRSCSGWHRAGPVRRSKLIS